MRRDTDGSATPIRRRGVTLIELLVVIAATGMLLGLLLPALGAARAAARQAACTSNLRQINTAAIHFAADHHGRLPGMRRPWEYDEQRDVDILRWWHGAWLDDGSDREYDEGLGLIAPYWGTADVAGCPSMELSLEQTSPHHGPVSYGYNNLVSNPESERLQERGLGVQLTTIQQPSRTILFADSARLNSGNELVRTQHLHPPSTANPHFHGRHRGEGNVGWADGHVSSRAPAVLRGTYERHRPDWPPVSGELIEQHNLGDIAPDDPARLDDDSYHRPRGR